MRTQDRVWYLLGLTIGTVLRASGGLVRQVRHPADDADVPGGHPDTGTGHGH